MITDVAVTEIEAQHVDTMTDVTIIEADEIAEVHRDDEVDRRPGEDRQVRRDEGTIMMIDEGMTMMIDEGATTDVVATGMIDVMIGETITGGTTMTGGIEDRIGC